MSAAPGRSHGELRQRRIKQCVYCPATATTKDHVPADSFLNEPFPARTNRMTVPCCLECNAALSLDQDYFLAVMTHVTESPTLRDRLQEGGSVDRMLTRAPGLDARIQQQLRPVGDRVHIFPQMERMHRVACATAQGLFFARYGVRGDPTQFSVVAVGPEADVLNGGLRVPDFLALFSERFRAKRWTRLQPGVFEYAFLYADGRQRLLCFARFHRTLLAVVECPRPSRRKILSKGRLARGYDGASGPVIGA